MKPDFIIFHVLSSDGSKLRQSAAAGLVRGFTELKDVDDPKKVITMININGDDIQIEESFDDVHSANGLSYDPHIMCRRALAEKQVCYDGLLHAMDKEIRDRAAEVAVGSSPDEFDDELEATVIAPKKKTVGASPATIPS